MILAVHIAQSVQADVHGGTTDVEGDTESYQCRKHEQASHVLNEVWKQFFLRHLDGEAEHGEVQER